MKLPQGKRITAGESESFLKVCKQLEKHFDGMIKLHGHVDGKRYSVDLLVDSSNVIAASLKLPEDGVEMKGDDVLSAMRKTLSGSEGEMELYSLKILEIHKAMDENRDALLKSEVPLCELKVKIKLVAKDRKPGKTDAEKIGGEVGREERELGLGSTGILGSILGVFRIKKMKQSGEKPKAGLPHSETIKQKRIRELKGERSEKVGKIKVGAGGEKIRGEGVVETTIDELYEILQENEKLKIDDRLAKKLGVTKTQIEAWAMILEEHNLLELHYPAIGEPEIRRIDVKEGGSRKTDR